MYITEDYIRVDRSMRRLKKTLTRYYERVELTHWAFSNKANVLAYAFTDPPTWEVFGIGMSVGEARHEALVEDDGEDKGPQSIALDV